MKIAEILEKTVKMNRFKNIYIFLFGIYKMVEITKETWKKNGVEVIIFNGKKWLNETNIKDQLKHSNLAAVTLQYSSERRKQRQPSWQPSTLQKIFRGRLCNANNDVL